MSEQNGILPRLLHTARGFLDSPREELRPLQRAAAAAIQVAMSSARKLRRDSASQMAAALSFQTLFSLLPLLVLALILLHSVRGLESYGEQLRNLIVEYLVPEGLVASEPALVGPPDPRGPATIEEFNDARQLLRQRIDGVLEALSDVSFAGIGAAGFLLFAYGATALMRTVVGSFNLIYQADSPRSWTRLPVYFTVLMLGPVALVAAQVLQQRLLEGVGSWMGGWINAPLAWIAPLVATIALLALAFRTLPNTWVAWRPAFTGAITSGITWFAFQEVFGLYVNRAMLTTLYGALALLPLFLLWIYCSWLIILAGLTLAFTLQYLAADEAWSRRHYLPGDPRWLVPIMARIAEAFDRGETMTMAHLSRQLCLPPRILRAYLKLLEKKGLVRPFRYHGGEQVLLLARPKSSIRVGDLLDLAPAPLPRGGMDSGVLRELHQWELDRVGDLTLGELLDRDRSAEGEPPERAG